MPHTSPLSKYKDACEILRNEIKLAIRDQEFSQSGKLWYAVDFSEIYTYVFPSESFKDFIIFPDAFNDDDEREDAIALQQLVLRYIFFDLSPDPKLVLLSPYILEFRTFVQSLPTKLFVDSVAQALKVFNDLEKIIDETTNADIETICKKIEDQEADSVSEEEQEILSNFVRDYGYIQSFLEEGREANHPFSRVKQLHPLKAFASLDDLISLPTTEDSEIYDRWVAKLRWSQKKLASTELDAAAINLIYEVNRNLNKNTRLILITRSALMHELYQKELEDGLWEDAGEYPLLRHPRVFSVALASALKSDADDLQDMQDLYDSINLFLEGYESQTTNEPTNDQTLTDQIEKIMRDWKRIQKTAFSLVSKSTRTNKDTRSRTIKQARSILGYVRNTQSARQRIVKILDELFYDIDVAHDVLGLKLQSPAAPLSILSTPHKVNFATEAGKGILSDLFRKSEINTEDVISTFKKVFEQDESDERQEEYYERNLAMAYILGSLFSQWQVAEQYCLRAIKIGERVNISTHEAIYFQAICKRETGVSDRDAKDHLLDVLDLLDKAIEAANHQEFKDQIVARYWVEKGISCLLFHKKYPEEIDKVPTATDSVHLLSQWDEKLENDFPLRLFALRTELDYLVANKRFNDLLQFKSKFNLLESLLLQYEHDSTRWPPFVVDLMTWGKWVLFPQDFKDRKRRIELVKQLEEVISSDSNKETRDEIIQHIKDVKKGSLYG